MKSLFLIANAPVLIKNGVTYLEAQGFNGLEKWAENFDAISVLYREINNEKDKDVEDVTWVATNKLNCLDKIKIITLPTNYKLHQFIISVIKNRHIIENEIKQNNYNVFSIAGLVGDWGIVAAFLAKRMNREYAVWTDIVAHNFIKISVQGISRIKKYYRNFYAALAEKCHRIIIKDAALGLFNGRDCFEEYHRYPKNSFVVHDIHLGEQDQITEQALAEKISQMSHRDHLKICYVGSMQERKGPREWIEIMHRLKEKKVKFKAKWLGAGALQEEIKNKLAEYRLADDIELCGFIADRERVKTELKNSDLFVFCHKLLESPRNLIEALKLGAPIIGFYSDYADDLITDNNGGVLIKGLDINRIAEEILKLSKDKDKIAELMRRAAKDGSKYSDTKSFNQRSELVKKYL